MARGDSIELACGDRLTGKIVSLCTSNVTLTNVYAGTLRIDRRYVSRLVTDGPMQVAFTNGDCFLGRIGPASDGQFALEPSNGVRRLAPFSAVAAAWRPGASNPLLPPPVVYAWKHAITFDITGDRGNAQSLLAGGSAEVSLASSNTDFRLYLRGVHGETEGQVSESQIAAGTDFEWRFLAHHSWYLRDEAEKDDVLGIDIRNLAAGGYGYYLVREPDYELRVRLGLGHSYTAYADPALASESAVSLDSGIRYRTKIGKQATWSSEITYQPPVYAFSHYYVTQESKLTIPLAMPKLSEEFGVCNQYEARTGATREALDTTYFARTRLSW